MWNWGQGEITWASDAYARSFARATERIHDECAKAGGQGVVGVHVDWEVHRHHIDVTLVGHGGAPGGVERALGRPGLRLGPVGPRLRPAAPGRAGPRSGLAAGASFVYAPRRSMGTAMKQKGQNVELTNFTEAMYAARESAMERMQTSALALEGTGVVEVKVTEGPMAFAHHAVGFTAYGTVVPPPGRRAPARGGEHDPPPRRPGAVLRRDLPAGLGPQLIGPGRSD